jgi:ADP-ribose pyrophosphatase
MNQLLSEQTIFQGKMLEVVHQTFLIDGKEVTFELARRSPGVRMIILSPDHKMILTKEYRREAKGWDYRLPGGKVYDALEEYTRALENKVDLLKIAEQAAQKEAWEEVGLGLKPEQIKYFSTSTCGATVEWDLHYFVIQVPDQKSGQQHLEHGEDISVEWYSLDEVKEIALSGKMLEDRSVAMLLKYLQNPTQL